MTPHGGEMGSGDMEIRENGASRGHCAFRQTVRGGLLWVNRVSLLTGCSPRDIRDGPATLNNPKANEVAVIAVLNKLMKCRGRAEAGSGGDCGQWRQISQDKYNPTFTSRKRADMINIWGDPGNTVVPPACGDSSVRQPLLTEHEGVTDFWEEILTP